MALYNSSSWGNINIGKQPNDGTGDPIRSAFNNIDGQFTYLNTYLSQPVVDFVGANFQQTLNAPGGNFGNIFVANLIGTNSVFTSNVTANYITANTQLYVGGPIITSGTITATGAIATNSTITATGAIATSGNITTAGITTSADIVPAVNGTTNLGSSARRFGTLYVNTTNTVTQINQSSDAPILVIHANSSGNSDVGILANVTDADNDIDNANYAFFGYELYSDNFVYKFTPNNTSTGNVVVGGIYGGAHFATLLLSNTDPSTSTSTGTLIVGGGVGVGGNLNVAGNTAMANLAVTGTGTINGARILTTTNPRLSVSIGGNLNVGGNTALANVAITGVGTINGAQIITTNSPGLGAFYNSGAIFTTPVLVNVATPSANVTSGALQVQGGVGVGGNINVGGGIYGQLLTDQTNMGNLATNGLIQANSISATYETVQYLQVTSTLTGLTSLSVTGATAAPGNIVTANLSATTVTATSTVTAATMQSTVGYFGNLQATTVLATNFSTANAQITGGNIGVTTLQATNFSTANAQITGGNVAVTNVTGTIQTASQPNITSVGNLSSVTVTGNITNTAGNVITSAIYTNNYRYANGAPFISTILANTTEITANASSGVAGLNLTTTGVTAGTYGSAANIPTIVVDVKGRITNITTNAVSTTLNLTGNTGTGSVVGGGTINIGGTLGFSVAVVGSNITLTPAQNLQTTATPTFAGLYSTATINATSVQATTIGNTGANIVGTIGSNAQPNITSVGTLTGLTVSGAILASTANTVNIGSTTNWFNNIYGTAIHAQYADLAENYTADAEYEPGTVVVFGGEAEITTTTQFADVRVAGAISTNPAYLMNDGIAGLPVALRGRVPVRVIGPVAKGDLLVTATAPGYAVSVGQSTEHPLAVFAKAIETDTTDGVKVITAVIL
jgi:hypothetical protein